MLPNPACPHQARARVLRLAEATAASVERLQAEGCAFVRCPDAPDQIRRTAARLASRSDRWWARRAHVPAFDLLLHHAA